MPNNYSSITSLSASQLSKLIKSKKVSPVEVLSSHLKLIDKINPSINAIVKLGVSAAMKWLAPFSVHLKYRHCVPRFP